MTPIQPKTSEYVLYLLIYGLIVIGSLIYLILYPGRLGGETRVGEGFSAKTTIKPKISDLGLYLFVPGLFGIGILIYWILHPEEWQGALLYGALSFGMMYSSLSRLRQRAAVAARLAAPGMVQVPNGIYYKRVPLSALVFVEFLPAVGIAFQVQADLRDGVFRPFADVVYLASGLGLFMILRPARKDAIELRDDGLRVHDKHGSYTFLWSNISSVDINALNNMTRVKIKALDRDALLATAEGPPGNGRDARSIRNSILSYTPELSIPAIYDGLDLASLLQTIQARVATAQTGGSSLA